MNSKSVSEINLFDVKTQQCPYEAYKTLRNEAPVYRCPATGMYVITRFEDVRQILTDTEHFTNETAYLTDATEPSPRARRVRDTFEQEGWVPAKTLNGRDDPDHKAVRSVFNDAFRPKKIESLEEEVRDLAYRLIDDFIDDGECEWVKQFAIPLPLLVIGKQMGANPDDIWRIKAWTEAFFHRISLMQSEEEELVSVRKEIEAQHYFQPIFERLREHPDDSLLSALVNTVIKEWGRPMNDNELHAEMMADTFVGGSETTTNAISAGVTQHQNKHQDQHLKGRRQHQHQHRTIASAPPCTSMSQPRSWLPPAPRGTPDLLSLPDAVLNEALGYLAVVEAVSARPSK